MTDDKEQEPEKKQKAEPEKESKPTLWQLAEKMITDKHGSVDQYASTFPEKRRFRTDKEKAINKHGKMIRKTHDKLRKKEEKLLKKEAKHIKKRGVPSVLLEAHPGFARMDHVQVLSEEIVEDPFDLSKRKDTCYTGQHPSVLEISNSIIPSWTARRLLPKKIRMRLYYRTGTQPFTRDPFTGGIVNPQKKHQIMKEKGFMDNDGFWLDTKTKKRLVVNKDGIDCYVKVDVSDIDFIKSEYQALEDSKAVGMAAKAMAKTGQEPNKILMWLMLAAFLSIVLIVIVMSGTLNEVF